MVNKAYVSGEYGSHPVTAQLDIDVLCQLLQRGQVAGVEVIGQRHVELLLVGLHVHICSRKMSVSKTGLLRLAAFLRWESGCGPRAGGGSAAF